MKFVSQDYYISSTRLKLKLKTRCILDLSNPFNFGHKLYFLVNQSIKFIACFLVLNWINESSVFFYRKVAVSKLIFLIEYPN